MKILLVDDEQLQLLRLENAVKKVLPDAELFSYTNPVKAFEENINNDIDIAFLDIEMPKINGIQLAKKLKKVDPLIKVIFVTAYNEYALDAFRVHASGYITKPVNENKIKEVRTRMAGDAARAYLVEIHGLGLRTEDAIRMLETAEGGKDAEK